MTDPGLAQGRLVRDGKTHGMIGPVIVSYGHTLSRFVIM